MLPVSAPFHSVLMKPAQDGLAEFMKGIEVNDCRFPVIRNVDAGENRTGADVRDGLIRQVTGCVRWVDSMRELKKRGVELALEIGPGKTLGGLLKRIDKSIKCMQVGSIGELDQALEAIYGQA